MKCIYFIVMLFWICACQHSESGTDIPRDDYTDSLGYLGASHGFQTMVPHRTYDIILSNPTNQSINLSVLCYRSGSGYISYGLSESSLENTATQSYTQGVPVMTTLNHLLPDKAYIYYFNYKTSTGIQQRSPKYMFRTQRSADSEFCFAVMADSHLDLNCDTMVYQRTLHGIATQLSDFLIDMGDTFMTDKYGSDYQDALGQYVAQRYYLGGICHSLPFFFVQGNHDGECGQKNVAMNTWSKTVRGKYFPNPASDNYFSWTWGDALFIVLDPYSYTPRQAANDPWQRTLGENQYNWLVSVLKNSTQKYKFVFIHNLVGGVDVDGQARGGSEVAGLYEWGGKNLLSQDEFVNKRPSWGMPIHQLLKAYGVNVVFHGHGHVYARQEYDGIIYQCVQQPGLTRYDRLTYAQTYGYASGMINYVPGSIKVTVNPTSVRIENISASNEIIDQYTIH